jgi:hypothetical protein
MKTSDGPLSPRFFLERDALPGEPPPLVGRFLRFRFFDMLPF